MLSILRGRVRHCTINQCTTFIFKEGRSVPLFLMDDGAKPPEEVIKHRWGLFCLKIPTNSLVRNFLPQKIPTGFLQLLDLYMTMAVKLWMPLLELSASDHCTNKIILSGFLMSVVLWVFFEMARKHRTPQGTTILSSSQILGCGAADSVGWHH